MKKIIKWTVIVAALAVVGYWGYDQVKPQESEVPMMEQPQMITFPVTEEPMASSIQVKGTSEYGRETNVYAPFEAKVESWNVENGQQIKQGDVLFELEQKAIRQQLQQKQAELQKRKLEQELKEFTQNQDLDQAPIGATEAERLKLLADQENARLSSQLVEVNDQIERATIAELNEKLQGSAYRSPDAGIFLLDNSQQLPQTVTANQYIGKIVDLDSLRFVAYVGENEIFSIKPDMAVEVKLPSIKDLRLKGKVVDVAKFAETTAQEKQTTQTPQFKVIISLPKDERLIGGLTLSGDIVTEHKPKAVVFPSWRSSRKVVLLMSWWIREEDRSNGRIFRPGCRRWINLKFYRD
ncbi:efflux RND transporter periplasmic adaptor subunit [Paenibacillus sp. JCM 10914]|uniref:efflux RND transporter periplasmic adaptor subunit n=1 Tax=Paenibacillus sp. JCM 10914 TaxID=1236974 RepID=UPI0003CC317D|nr:efflux RND transporter periplasmic adaptor subunit [Paenibacillus sp. JCM 10914]GAE08224.1 possible membrane fusion protein [Paenibacillus sp. JCM 10914]